MSDHPADTQETRLNMLIYNVNQVALAMKQIQLQVNEMMIEYRTKDQPELDFDLNFEDYDNVTPITDADK